MKRVLLLLAWLQCTVAMAFADDARFRFHRLEGATTVHPYEVANAEGKNTTIVLSKDSDAASVAILNALIGQQGIWGSLAPKKDPQGITWDQGIILIGSFVPEPKRLPEVPNGAAEGPYQEFKINKINIEFPFARWVETDENDPVDTPYVVEFHLELRSLIPKGILLEGKAIDLRSYETKSKSEQGAAGQPATPP